jgi:hypothetical protein
MKNGHSAGTATAGSPVNGGAPHGAAVLKTVAPAARLLNLRAAGTYIGVSYWTMRDLVNAGMLPVVRFPVPRAKDGRTIRRVLIDREDLDRMIEANKETE